MRISELASQTGVPVATLKYYLREGLLHGGVSTSATRATYDGTHVARVHLIRALTESGGLSIAGVRRVVRALDAPPPSWHDLLGEAQATLMEQPDGCAEAPSREGGTVGGEDPARELLARVGWQFDPQCPAVDQLRQALLTAERAGVLPDGESLVDYAGALARVAEVDVRNVPRDPAAALEFVVVGTVLLEPVLRALRLLAQQDASARRFATGGSQSR